MAGASRSTVCTVVDVKPFSGYYPACYNCRRKLRQCQGSDTEFSRYRCRGCREDYEEGGVGWRYCLGLAVSDGSAVADVVAFGEQLDVIFGAPACQLHRYIEETSLVLSIGQPGACHRVRSLLEDVLVGRCLKLGFRHNSQPRGASMRHQVVRGCSLSLLKMGLARDGVLANGSLAVSTLTPLGRNWCSVMGVLERQFDAHAASRQSSMSSMERLGGVSQCPVEGSRLDDSLACSLTSSPVKFDSFSFSVSSSGASTAQHGCTSRIEPCHHMNGEWDHLPSNSSSSELLLADSSSYVCSTLPWSMCATPSQLATNCVSSFTEEGDLLASGQPPTIMQHCSDCSSCTVQQRGSVDTRRDSELQPASEENVLSEEACSFNLLQDCDADDFLDKLVFEWESTQSSPGSFKSPHTITTDDSQVSSFASLMEPGASTQLLSSSSLGADFLTEFEGTFNQSSRSSKFLCTPAHECPKVVCAVIPALNCEAHNTPEMFSDSGNRFASVGQRSFSPELFGTLSPSYTDDLRRNVLRRFPCSHHPTSRVSIGTPVLPRANSYICRRNLIPMERSGNGGRGHHTETQTGFHVDSSPLPARLSSATRAFPKHTESYSPDLF